MTNNIETKDTELFGKMVAVTKDGCCYVHSYTDNAGKLRKGKWLNKVISRGRYRYNVRDGKQVKPVYVSQLIMKAWGTPAPADMVEPTIDHIDNDKTNDHIDNLQWLSHSDNIIKEKAKTWKFIDPMGEVREIYNLFKFCKENKLDHSAMSKVNKGTASHHKGWTRFQG